MIPLLPVLTFRFDSERASKYFRTIILKTSSVSTVLEFLTSGILLSGRVGKGHVQIYFSDPLFLQHVLQSPNITKVACDIITIIITLVDKYQEDLYKSSGTEMIPRSLY